MLRAVIDTNVLVSSFFGGKPREVMNLWRDGKFALCLSDGIVAEYLEVLARFSAVKKEIEEFLMMLTERANVVFATPAEVINEIADDPDDNKFLGCAVAAKADMIVSGDQHLLSLGVYRNIRVVEPLAFLDSVWRESQQAES